MPKVSKAGTRAGLRRFWRQLRSYKRSVKPCLHWRRLRDNAGINDSDSYMKQYLPWPPWATQQKIETILSVSRCPRWPRQVLCHVAAVAVTDSFAYKLCQSKRSIRKTKSDIKKLFSTDDSENELPLPLGW